jgi:hypothetical protein
MLKKNNKVGIGLKELFIIKVKQNMDITMLTFFVICLINGMNLMTQLFRKRHFAKFQEVHICYFMNKKIDFY